MSESRFLQLSNLMNASTAEISDAQYFDNSNYRPDQPYLGMMVHGGRDRQNRNVQLDSSSYKLIAIIVQNVKNDSFKQFVKTNFEVLSDMSGNNCLFYSFLTPDNDLLYNNRQADRFYVGNEIDSPLEVAKIRRLFQLKGHPNPLILLTNDIKGNKFFVINTSENRLFGQLSKIASFCNKSSHLQKIPLESLMLFVSQLGVSQTYHSCDKPIGEILLEIEAEHISSTDSSREKSLKKKLRTQKIQNLETKIQNGNSINTAYDDFCSLSEVLIADQGACDDEQTNYLISGDQLYEDCEDDALEVIEIFNGLSRQCARLEYRNCKMRITAMCFFLGQMFEIEIVHSIVQKMRQFLGIDMSRYYCMPKTYERQYGKESFCVTVKNGYSVDLNKRNCKTNSWQPPELGRAQDVFEILIKYYQFQIDEDLCSEKFKTLWKELAYARNDSAHGHSIPIDSFENAWLSFNEMWNTYVPQLLELKKEIKPANLNEEAV